MSSGQKCLPAYLLFLGSPFPLVLPSLMFPYFIALSFYCFKVDVTSLPPILFCFQFEDLSKQLGGQLPQTGKFPITLPTCSLTLGLSSKLPTFWVLFSLLYKNIHCLEK